MPNHILKFFEIILIADIFRKPAQNLLNKHFGICGGTTEGRGENKGGAKPNQNSLFPLFRMREKIKRLVATWVSRIRPKKIDFLQLGHLHVNGEVCILRGHGRPAFAHLFESIRWVFEKPSTSPRPPPRHLPLSLCKIECYHCKAFYMCHIVTHIGIVNTVSISNLLGVTIFFSPFFWALYSPTMK